MAVEPSSDAQSEMWCRLVGRVAGRLTTLLLLLPSKSSPDRLKLARTCRVKLLFYL
jgi:hypothetical protein